MKNLICTLTLILVLSVAMSAQSKYRVFQMETIPAGYTIGDRNEDGYNEVLRALLSEMYVAPGTVTGQAAADTTGTAVLAVLDARIDAAVAGSVADLAINGSNLEAGGDPVLLTAISPIQSVTVNGGAVVPNGAGLLALTDTDTQLDETAVDAFVADNGYLTSETDGSTSNELQDLSYNGTTGVLSLSSSGATADLLALKNPTPRVDVDAFTSTAAQTAFTLPFTPRTGAREIYYRNGQPIPESQWSRTGTALTLSLTPALYAGETIGYDTEE